MKTTFYINNKKTTRKALKEMLAQAKETFFDDPLTLISFYLGGREMLTIEFA